MPGPPIPDLTGNLTDGVNHGVPGGVTSPVSSNIKPPILQTNAIPGATSPIVQLQTRWRPDSLLDFHAQILQQPEQASWNLDRAIGQAYQNQSVLETMIASRQAGSATVTGSITGIPTGLTTVSQVQASIDNGSGAHNFWVSATTIGQPPGCIGIFVWQPTAAGNNTPIACITPVVVRWVANGSIG